MSTLGRLATLKSWVKQNLQKSYVLVGLTVVGALPLVIGLWQVQADIKDLQEQVESLRKEIQNSKTLKTQERFALQKDIAGLEKDRITLANNIYATLVQAVGGAALLAGLCFTWRNQKIAEVTAANNHKSAQQTLELSQEGQVTERFTRAIDQLGADKLEIRMGGIYALERIAKDSPKNHWTIIEVLTSFIPKKSSSLSTEEGRQENSPKIAKDAQAALTVIRRRDATKDPEHLRLDLQSTNLRGACLGAYVLSGEFIPADLRRTDFYEACLSEADLKASNLSEAVFVKASLENANLSKASLENANLSFAVLIRSNLVEAVLRKAIFEKANLEGAALYKTDARETSFFEAHLSGASFRESNLQLAKFQFAHLEGACLKGANLRNAHLMGTCLVEADLTEADLKDANLHNANLCKTHLREAKNLTPEQVKSANNWEQALYSESFRKELGLPPELLKK